jgi:hypothetical protein
MRSMPDPERWVTDDDLLAARRRFADRLPNFRPPIAYTVARLDDGQLTFAQVNDPTIEHQLSRRRSGLVLWLHQSVRRLRFEHRGLLPCRECLGAG